MKGKSIIPSFILYLKAVSALYPINIDQVQNFNTESHYLKGRTDQEEIKPFNISVNCYKTECKKVSDTFDRLANTLSSFIEVKNQININVNFASDCKLHKHCKKHDKYDTRSSSASGSGTLKNKEGVETVYPRALYKQLIDPSELEHSKSFKDTDIHLFFNSDVNYWFEGDENTEDNKLSFTLAAADGLIRGLGVYVTIQGYNDKELVFFPSFKYEAESDGSKYRGSIKFERYILNSLIATTSDGESINSILDPFIDFKSGKISIPVKEIDLYLKNTTLIEASKKIEKLATTPDSLAIKLPSGKSLILETSIHPYDPIRSLRFISESKYLHTKEALLTSKVIYGEEPLPQEKSEDWPTYPFGPLLIETLGLMGYTLKGPYKNNAASTSSKDEDKSNSKSGNNSTNVKINYGLLAALISLYLVS